MRLTKILDNLDFTDPHHTSILREPWVQAICYNIDQDSRVKNLETKGFNIISCKKPTVQTVSFYCAFCDCRFEVIKSKLRSDGYDCHITRCPCCNSVVTDNEYASASCWD